jgi:hypothetical protein
LSGCLTALAAEAVPRQAPALESPHALGIDARGEQIFRLALWQFEHQVRQGTANREGFSVDVKRKLVRHPRKCQWL